MQKFNGMIKNHRIKMFNFSSALSHQLLHCLDVHLYKSIDSVIVQIGINDLLTNSGRSGIRNIKKITKKYLMFGVKN